MSPDAIIDWPLSGERISHPGCWKTIQEHYPGVWTSVTKLMMEDSGRVFTVTSVTSDTENDLALSIFTVNEGAITSLIQYWPATYPPASWRSAWVNRIPGPSGETNMTSAQCFQLSTEQRQRAQDAVGHARAYLESANFSVGLAQVDHLWSGGSAQAAMDALAAYQNPDGGFGNGLEVDIKSPASNPFAARLAMQVLLDLRDRPESDMVTNLQAWLVANQAEDGDWHFSAETKSGELAPWFAGWTFPSLNPACCIVGLANRLGISTPKMRNRVERLFSEKASLEEARTGEFYSLLPYVEYFGHGANEDRDGWLDAIAENISNTAKTNGYADAGHFWDHVLGGGPDIVSRISADVLSDFADALLAEQEEGGNWPSPYDPAWKPFVTARACSTLAHLNHNGQS